MMCSKGFSFLKEELLQAVRWYGIYNIRYRAWCEFLSKHYQQVGREIVPQLEDTFQGPRRRPGHRVRMDKTYILVKGKWYYFISSSRQAGANLRFPIDERTRYKTADSLFP